MSATPPDPRPVRRPSSRSHAVLAVLVLCATLLGAGAAQAHGVADRDEAFLAQNEGLAVVPYMYLGAKHMVTGYDHLLFLAGVIFFLFRLRDVALYVTLFALGHSSTLLLGVLGEIHANPYLVDAVVGLSVAYKALDNLGGFCAFGLRIDQRLAVLAFGLVHGFGLATKLQSVTLSEEGLVGNMLSFNAGVELGQFAALAVILALFQAWRASGRFLRHAFVFNCLLLTAGWVLFGYQLAGYFLSR
ncbi:MAG TPA: HupE/UreJ family protein [Thermoanaerobaculia bacterium]|nr:HupE/UreJ family protein [Thermoanaerobaculia bacterium]